MKDTDLRTPVKHTKEDRKPFSKFLVPPVITIIGCLLVSLLGLLNVTRFLEYKAYDLRVSLRNKHIFSEIQSPTHKRNPDIALVPIDNATLKALNTPFLSWNVYFHKVFNRLIDNGAAVIALDYQFQISSDEYINRQMLAVYEKLVKDRKINLDYDVFTEYLPKNDLEMFKALRKKKVVLMIYLKENGEVEMPYSPYMYAAGMENLGLVNNEPDDDGVVRRQFLYKTEILPEGESRNFLVFDLVTAGRMKNQPVKFDKDLKRMTLGSQFLPHDANYMINVNYVGPPGTYTNDFNFLTLLKKAQEGDDEFFRKNFAGKAVLIGPGFTGSTDLVLTPYNIFNRMEMFGIEVHANILNTILNRDFIRPASAGLNYGILLFVALLVSFLCYNLRPHVSAFWSIFIGLVFVAVSFYVFYRYNLWINMAMPISVIPVNYGLAYVYRYMAEDREKRYIRKILGRYISEQVAMEILKDPSNLALGGKRSEVSIIFCDINNFTTMSERSSPEEVISILNDYFTRMERVIFENRGTLKQFVGDEIMVICGAPQADPRHAETICRIALEMEKELIRWQDERKAAGKNVFDVKFGIHSGAVVAGNVGSPHRTEYTTVGDVVNTASRIMGLTKATGSRILISEATCNLIGDKFLVEEKGTFPVKGKEEMVKVYHLVGIKDEISQE